MPSEGRWILSPVRLPIPPLQQVSPSSRPSPLRETREASRNGNLQGPKCAAIVRTIIGASGWNR